MVEEKFQHSEKVASKSIQVFTAPSDYEVTAALCVNLLTNLVGAERCAVHTIEWCFTHAFKYASTLQMC